MLYKPRRLTERDPTEVFSSKKLVLYISNLAIVGV